MRIVCFINQIEDHELQEMLQGWALPQKKTVQLLEVTTLSLLAPGTCDFVLVNLNKITPQFIQELKTFRHQINVPVLLMANQIPVAAYQQLAELRRILVLQTPLSPQVLHSLLNRALSGELLGQDCLPRFLTDEPVRVIDTRTGLLLQTRMLNYSPTGAFLEYRGISVKIGARLKLEFVNDRHGYAERLRYEAKVIWIKGGHGTEGCRGVGVQFYNDVQV